MAILDVRWKPSRKELRTFGLLLLAFAAILSLVLLYRGARDWLWLPATLAGLGLVGSAFPVILRPVWVGWLALTFPIGWIVSHTLMGILFYLIVTPIGLARRLFQRDPLGRRLQRSSASHWRERSKRPVEQYFREF